MEANDRNVNIIRRRPSQVEIYYCIFSGFLICFLIFKENTRHNFFKNIYLHSDSVVVSIDALPKAFTLELLSDHFTTVTVGAALDRSGRGR